MIYLDHAATTPVRREVLEAMWPYLTGEFGNASSHHELGTVASAALKKARTDVAAWFGCRASEVTFTSGGTEAINLAVKGIALSAPRGRHLVTTPLEHEATLESFDYLRRFHGFEVEFVRVDADGRIDLAHLAELLRDDSTLVSVSAANNEIGTLQDSAAISELCRAKGVPLHVDAVQAAGWIDLSALGADAISISGHKLGAPKGVGALYARSRLRLEPVIHGGGQEGGRRSGTENVAAAVGLATAVRLSEADREARSERMTHVRDRFIARVEERMPDARLTGSREQRLPTIASFLFPTTSGESVLLALEERGVVVSSGSACAAGSDEASHVLVALGVSPAEAQTAVRFSFGTDSSEDDADAAVDALVAAVAAARSLGTH